MIETSGHLFVTQGDATRLAADGYVVPCDGVPHVSPGWRGLLDGPELKSTPHGWLRLDGVTLDGCTATLQPRSDGSTRVLVDTVSGVQRIDDIVDRCLDAVRLAADGAENRGGRAVPLVVVPLVGTGEGLLRGRKAELVRALVAGLQEFVARNHVDVALVLGNGSSLAAVQWARREGPAWNLDDELLAVADDLGRRAAKGALSIFVGAGASKPVGFPDWKGLLEKLGAKQEDLDAPGADLTRIASDLNYSPDQLAEIFRTDRYALAHSFLVNLGTQAMVTTNYDPCLENAALGVRDPLPRIMARELAEGGRQWLLKLHGDVAQPSSMILTEKQYSELSADRRALRGIVQTLMLTSHLLFVGFGFADVDFLEMASAVSDVRRLAQPERDREADVGTALELRESGRRAHLRHLSMGTVHDDASAAARRLEIFLDRVAWRSQVDGQGRAAYLLDPSFRQDARDADDALVRALEELERQRPAWAASAGAGAVDDLLRALGASPAS